MEFNVQNYGNNTYLVCNPGIGQNIDSFTYGMISNNQIKGLLPVTRSSINGNVTLKYLISSKISVKNYFFSSGKVNRNDVLNFISNVCDSVLDFQEYMLGTEEFVWDADYIYIDPVKGDISLVCMPVQGFCSTITLKNFLLNLIVKSKVNELENVDYVAIILNNLNSSDTVDVKKLRELMRDLKAADTKYVKPADEGTAQVNIDKDLHAQTSKELSGGKYGVLPAPPDKLPEKAADDAPKGIKGILGQILNKDKNTASNKKKHDDIPSVFGGIEIPGMEEKTDSPKAVTAPDNLLNQKEAGYNGIVDEDTAFFEQKEEDTTFYYEESPDLKENVFLMKLTGEKYVLDSAYYVLGSALDCNGIISGNKLISRHHAVIIQRNNMYYISDLHSKNHTRVNEIPVEPDEEKLLNNGDVIRLANITLKFTAQ